MTGNNLRPPTNFSTITNKNANTFAKKIFILPKNHSFFSNAKLDIESEKTVSKCVTKTLKKIKCGKSLQSSKQFFQVLPNNKNRLQTFAAASLPC